jgi:hypothetical protein
VKKKVLKRFQVVNKEGAGAMKKTRALICGILVLSSAIGMPKEARCFELREGEKLEYSAKFLYVIPIGKAVMQIKDAKPDFGGKKIYFITCEARTAKWMALLFKAEAVLNSYMEAKNLYPYKFEQILKVAGKPDDIRRATYDRVNNIMDAEGKGKKRVAPDVRDPVSSVYYLRTIPFKDGMQIEQRVNNNQHTYIFKSVVRGKKKIGIYNCWVLDSKIRRENKSMYHSMDAVIYISDDTRHLPVLIKAKTKVGPVELRLK